ncbi:hypothetical protein [Nocardia alni]|uniref:hypothetical protein n=1 Tax=Nocardia alni TaxID=2815723 RepID=UPI001C211F75|nr:hypothetical protein [Nocardia alni]
MASEELESKLRTYRERWLLAEMTERLGGILTGRRPATGQIPERLYTVIGSFWDCERWADARLTDEADESQLAQWTEAQLADHGITGTCWVGTHLRIDPWLECEPAPGWTTHICAAIPRSHTYLAADARAVVVFHESEYFYEMYAAAL